MNGRYGSLEAILGRLNMAVEGAGRPLTFMEVCGTHTMAIFRSGLHSLLPAGLRLISGPGCPVCVTSQGDIDALVALADIPHAIVCTYGDMIRVPGSNGSLERARANGADLRVIYSSMDAVKIASENPSRPVVFAAIGFETTAPATAAAIDAAKARSLANFHAYISHKTILPAMHALLSGDASRLDGFLLPGHVSVIIGSEAYRPVVERYRIPCVISGFEDIHMIAALMRLAELASARKVDLENVYPQAVKPLGNPAALALLEKVFRVGDASWRGLGPLPGSALVLNQAYEAFDARRKYALPDTEVPEPAGCRCGEVILGKTTPAECGLFGTVCTPTNPVGPCMVSSEGTCQAWFKYQGTRIPEPSKASA
ncbi:MAG: hydrogenase formation protein HypD [Spirochaetes bacterium]|nr:hydrogenase formation protein HypD [Spirochaetota bacterium]